MLKNMAHEISKADIYIISNNTNCDTALEPLARLIFGDKIAGKIIAIELQRIFFSRYDNLLMQESCRRR
jgi:hypothetical protein